MIEQEMARILIRKKTWFAVLLLIAVFIGSYLLLQRTDESYQVYTLDNVKNKIASEERELEKLKAALAPLEKKTRTKDEEEYYQSSLAVLAEGEKLVQGFREELKKYGDDQSKYLQDQVESYYDRMKKRLMSQVKTPQEQLGQTQLVEVLSLNSRAGVLPDDFLRGTSSFEMIEFTTKTFYPAILLIMLGMIGADIISGERKPPTLKQLLGLPVSRGHILLSKVIAFILCAILLICVIQLSVFLIVGTIHSWGQFQEKVLIDGRYVIKPSDPPAAIHLADTGHVISGRALLLLASLNQFAVTITCAAFIVFLSVWTRNGLTTFAIVSVVAMGWFFIQNQSQLFTVVKPYLFLSYLNPFYNLRIQQLAVNNLFTIEQVHIPPFMVGQLILWLTSAILMAAAWIRFRKMDLYL